MWIWTGNWRLLSSRRLPCFLIASLGAFPPLLPVSALLHAATMIVAGAFLALRLSPLSAWLPLYSSLLLWIGLITSFYAGILGSLQPDLKRIIAFSTCSHVALVLCALGSLMPALALCHLLLHASAKAVLFMAAGALIHHAGNDQDTRYLTAIAVRHLPLISLTLVTASLSLAGLPGLAGATTKDALVLSLWASLTAFESGNNHNAFAMLLLLFALLMSSAYSAILIVSLALSPSRHSHNALIRPPAPDWLLALSPLLLLPIATMGGYLLGDAFLASGTDAHATHDNDLVASVSLYYEHSPQLLKALPPSILLLIISLRLLLSVTATSLPRPASYRSWTPNSLYRLYRGLGNRGHWDQLHYVLVIMPTLSLARYAIATVLDAGLLDTLGVTGAFWIQQACNRTLGLLYSGLLAIHFSLLIGMATACLSLVVL